MKRRVQALRVAIPILAALAPLQASAQEAMLGEVRTFGFNFCPRHWAPAEGQLIDIDQNTALFSLFGTIYGGDGRRTFALPDLRNRSIIHGSETQRPGTKSQITGVETNETESVAAPDVQGTLTMTTCIALQGTYPSRN